MMHMGGHGGETLWKRDELQTSGIRGGVVDGDDQIMVRGAPCADDEMMNIDSDLVPVRKSLGLDSGLHDATMINNTQQNAGAIYTSE